MVHSKNNQPLTQEFFKIYFSSIFPDLQEIKTVNDGKRLLAYKAFFNLHFLERKR